MASSKKKLKEEKLSKSVELLEKIEKRILRGLKNNFMDTQQEGDSFVLTPLNGNHKDTEPYFLHLKEQKWVLMPNEMFLDMIELLHSSYEERFCMQLEREIARQMPRDFDDIWEIAITEIKKSKKGILKVDPECLIASIKKQHPHLFVQLDIDWP